MVAPWPFTAGIQPHSAGYDANASRLDHCGPQALRNQPHSWAAGRDNPPVTDIRADARRCRWRHHLVGICTSMNLPGDASLIAWSTLRTHLWIFGQFAEGRTTTPMDLFFRFCWCSRFLSVVTKISDPYFSARSSSSPLSSLDHSFSASVSTACV